MRAERKSRRFVPDEQKLIVRGAVEVGGRVASSGNGEPGIGSSTVRRHGEPGRTEVIPPAGVQFGAVVGQGQLHAYTSRSVPSRAR